MILYKFKASLEEREAICVAMEKVDVPEREEDANDNQGAGVAAALLANADAVGGAVPIADHVGGAEPIAEHADAAVPIAEHAGVAVPIADPVGAPKP